MKAEREKRAVIARSLGEMESKINYSQAAMEEAINKSEGEKEKRINEAQGKAEEIFAIAKATASGIAMVSEAIEATGGEEAVTLRIAEGYIAELNKLAKRDTKLILPMDLSDINTVMNSVDRILKRS
jgi:regulator of protease activity HflC (stomatin/prohibitin superfamily)